MKRYSAIALLVICVLLLSLTACTRPLSTPRATTPTAGGEVPFPFETSDIATFGTQTVIAQTPVGNTPQAVVTATEQPEAGGGQEAPEAKATAAPQSEPQKEAAVINTPVVKRPSTYVLQKGEWPICIARRYDLDLSSFFAANGLTMDSKPMAGTSLRIPSSGNWSAGTGGRALKAHPATYTVVAGDTVYTIACKYGDVTPEAILAVNSLSSASDIKAGMSLKIP
jgi:LysM repeat protein